MDEEQWLGFARKHTIKDLNWIADHFRYGWIRTVSIGTLRRTTTSASCISAR
jgi:hypothetical protein